MKFHGLHYISAVLLYRLRLLLVLAAWTPDPAAMMKVSRVRRGEGGVRDSGHRWP